MNRSGLIAVVDEKGREKERHHVVYGARLKVEDGQPVTLGQTMVEWDPYTFSILTETGGTIEFKDLQPGITIEEQVDEVTGLSQLVVTLPPGDEKHQPTILVRDSAGPRQEEVPDALARALDGRRWRRGAAGRRAGEDSARNHQDQGHHRRSAARRRTFRNAQAARPRGHQRNRRRGEVRRNQPRASARSTSRAKMARR
jgi:hypothetical protein